MLDASIATAAAKRAAGHAPPTETERILAIPRVLDLSVRMDGGADLVAHWTAALRLRPEAPPLRPVQAFALDALARNAASGTPRGLLAPIGVGHGKTLVALLASEVTADARCLLLTAPSLYAQMLRDLEYWRRFYRFRPPTVMPYSELSSAKATSFLSYYRPDLIIADEVQALRHMTSARTKRVVRYFREHPATRFVAMSGTLTSKTVRDYAHLAELALREHSPLPLAEVELDLWGSVLDPDGEPDFKAMDAVWPLVGVFAPHTGAPTWRDQSPKARQVTARVAYRRRLATTPGVVTSTDASVGSTLYLAARVPDVPSRVQAILDGLETTWSLPDAEGRAGEGEQIADALTMARAGAQISAGFYYVWDWPRGAPDVEWLEARANWHKAVRGTLRSHSRDGYDSPLLVANAAERGQGSDNVLLAWKEWRQQKHKKPPPVRAVWVDRYLIADALAWAHTRGRPVVLWYYSRAVGDALLEAGMQVYGQGTDAPPDGKTCAASITVHGKGRNLQAWCDALVLEPPSSGAVWEQLIGRHHRQGQASDAVAFTVYQHTPRTLAALETANKDARYIEDTQGVAQRLNFGVWVTEREAADALKNLDK